MATASSEKRHYQKHQFLPQSFRTKLSGIYAIINRDNLKLYIGSGVNLCHRWAAHRHDLWLRKHNSRYFQRAFEKNPDAFYIEVIEELPKASKERILNREQFWIDFYKSYLSQNGYNIAPKAKSCQGIRRSAEFLSKVSASLSKPWSEERKQHYRKLRSLNQPRGWKWTEEQKTRHSEVHKGIRWKPGHKEKWHQSISKNANAFNRKSVIQLSLDGSLIAEFRTIKEAELKFGKRSNIHAVCKGERHSCFGFKWRYVNG